jgi:hypothetical protein
MSRDKHGNTAQIAPNNVILLAGEDLEQVTRYMTFFNRGETRMTNNLAFEGFKVHANLRDELDCVRHG